MKKDESLSKSVIKYAITIAVLLLVLMAVVNILPFLNKYDTYIIQTNSMQPLINVDDVVVIDTEFTEDDLREGVVIAFYQDIMGDYEEEIVVHRIDDVYETEDGELQVKTMGDFIERQDEWTLEVKDIIGIYNTKVSGVGNYLAFLQSWIGRGVLIADILIIYALFKVLTNKKENEKKDIDEKSHQQSPEGQSVEKADLSQSPSTESKQIEQNESNK